MTTPKKHVWPTDDEAREGHKTEAAEQVGAKTPDTDAEELPPVRRPHPTKR